MGMAAFARGCWCYNTCKAGVQVSIGGMSSDLPYLDTAIGVFEKEFASTGNSTPQQAINVCFMVVLLSLVLLLSCRNQQETTCFMFNQSLFYRLFPQLVCR